MIGDSYVEDCILFLILHTKKYGLFAVKVYITCFNPFWHHMVYKEKLFKLLMTISYCTIVSVLLDIVIIVVVVQQMFMCILFQAFLAILNIF